MKLKYYFFTGLIVAAILTLYLTNTCADDPSTPVVTPTPVTDTPTPTPTPTPATPSPTPASTPTPTPTDCSDDTTPPALNKSVCLPADGETEVEIASMNSILISLAFNENIDEDSLSSTTYTISPDGNSEILYFISSGSKSIMLQAFNVQCDSTYTIGVNGVTDVCGNTMTTADSITFSTDSQVPQIESSVPQDGATGIYASISTVTLTFDEDVDGSSAIFSISPDSNGETVSYNSSESDDDVIVLDIDNIPCNASDTYTITIQDVVDVCGYAISSDNISFTVIPDSIPPVIESSTPADGETEAAVPVNEVEIVFDEEVDGSTGNYIISPTTFGETAVYNSTESSGNVVVIDIGNIPCDQEITYTITISNVEDLCGIPMISDEITFRTKSDTENPYIIMSIPYNNAIDVDAEDPSEYGYNSIYAAFNEEVDGSGGTYTISPTSSGETISSHHLNDYLVSELLLSVENLQDGITYTVEINGVVDNCLNTMTPDTLVFTTEP